MTINNTPYESEEAITLVAWLRVKGYPFTHIPSETGHSPEALRRAIRMKRAGVSKGFPDYMIFTGRGNIAIELKRIKGGRASPEQKMWLATLADYGFKSAVCHGANEAIEFIESVTK